MSQAVPPNDRRKAAILCISVGAEQSAKLLQFLEEDEIEMLTVEIAKARGVEVNEIRQVLDQFQEQVISEKSVGSGGIEYARQVLEKVLDSRKVEDMLLGVTSRLRKRPFDSIARTDPTHLAAFLQNEHPQTIAVVVAHLAPEQGAVVLASLPEERQADVIKRVATIERTSPEMVREVEKVMERKLSAQVAQERTAAGGLPWAVDILNRVDRSTERGIMNRLSDEDPDLAQEIAQRMFLFDDIVHLHDRTVQRVLREVDMSKDLPLALKAAKDEVWDKILRNVSKRAGESLKESVELLGPVRIRDVEEAQTRIITKIRELEEKGEIQISRGGGDDEFI